MQRSLQALEFPQLCDELAKLASYEETTEHLKDLRPSSDIGWIRNEMDRVEEVRDLILRGGGFGLGGLRDIRFILKKLSATGSLLPAEELLVVLHHLRVHSTVHKTIFKNREKMPKVAKLAEALTPLTELEQKLSRSIQPDATIHDRASRELARIRHAITSQQDRIRRKLTSMLPRLKKALRDDSFTIRGGRYVLPVRSDSVHKVKGIVQDRSSTGGTLFIEPLAIVDLGNEFRALELAERDEIRRILLELTEHVRLELAQIDLNHRILTDLDILWAKAQLSERLDSIVPTVTKGGPLRLAMGRHPLLVLSNERKVVPLNLELGVDWTTLVISGPNAGGKTVAIKCVGLLALMVACGLPIPALPGSEVPLFTDFQADIGDQQSISDDLSTFTAHASRLNEMVNTAHTRSLVLVDEIGSGTDPHEGSALSISILEQLIERKIPTIVTTHHSALKSFAHSTDGCANGSMEFDRKTLSPTYRFHANIPGSSYALEIASRVGLSDQIINRAREVLGSDRAELEDLIMNLTEKMRSYDKLVVDEKKQATAFANYEEEYNRRLTVLKEREKSLKSKAKSEAQEILSQARKTVEAIVREIREKQADKGSIKVAHKALEEIEKSVLQDSNKQSLISRDPDLKPIKLSKPKHRKPKIIQKQPEIGDIVAVDGTNTTGEISAMSDKGERVCVAVGSVQIWVAKDRVSVVKPPEESKPTTMIMPKLPEVPLELNIRGLNLEDAMEKVDRYVADGFAAGKEQLAIIHGKGDGILSNSVRIYLKRHKLVKSFRFGKHGEGDFGITIISMKTK